ncbi:19626_t:CDS:2, partial [Funneliformis geosporum]
HAYHEEYFRVVGLKCKYCYKYLNKSIDELTKSYNQRLHLEETQLELNDKEIDEDNCEVKKSDNYKPKIEADSELQKRIIVLKPNSFLHKPTPSVTGYN